MKKVYMIFICFFSVLSADLPDQTVNYALPSYSGLAHAGGAIDAGSSSFWVNPAHGNYDLPYSVSISRLAFPGTDLNISEISGFYRYNDKQLITGGLNYENYGQFTARDIEGNETGEFTAAQYQLMLGYNRKMSNKLRAGIQGIYFSNRIENSRLKTFFVKYGASYTFGERSDMLAFSASSGAGETRWRLAYSHRLEYLPLRIGLDYRRQPGNNRDYLDSETGRINWGGLLIENLKMLALGAEADVNEALLLHFGFDFQRLELRSESFGLSNMLSGLGLGGQYHTGNIDLHLGVYFFGDLGSAVSLGISYCQPKE